MFWAMPLAPYVLVSICKSILFFIWFLWKFYLFCAFFRYFPLWMCCCWQNSQNGTLWIIFSWIFHYFCLSVPFTTLVCGDACTCFISNSFTFGFLFFENHKKCEICFCFSFSFEESFEFWIVGQLAEWVLFFPVYLMDGVWTSCFKAISYLLSSRARCYEWNNPNG